MTAAAVLRKWIIRWKYKWMICIESTNEWYVEITNEWYVEITNEWYVEITNEWYVESTRKTFISGISDAAQTRTKCWAMNWDCDDVFWNINENKCL
jgi:hypothetical protein